MKVQNVPLYINIANQIKKMILHRDLKPGDILQSEHELIAEFKTSRTTIRKGMSVLLTEGYIVAIPGKGYFVKEPDVDKYTLLFNERNCIENYSGKPKLIKVDVINPSQEIATKLELRKTNKVILVEWLHYADHKPAAFDTKYLPYDKGKPIVEEEIHYATLPEMVAQHTSLFGIDKTLRITTTRLTREVARILQADDDAPAILVEQKLFNQKENPIGWSQLVIRFDCFSVSAYSSYNNNSFNNNSL